MRTHDDTSLGAVRTRLHENGYAATSATHPDRLVSQFSHGRRRDSFIALAAHPAAIMAYPRVSNGASEALEDCEHREVIVVTLTAYLLASPEWRAVKKVLDAAGVMAAPARVDNFGNARHIMRWNGPPIFDGEHGARLTHDDDDQTVFLEHAIAPERTETRTDSFGRQTRVAGGPVVSHVIELAGEWRGGHPLDTPREKLPELRYADVPGLIADVERARWDGRPCALKAPAAA